MATKDSDRQDPGTMAAKRSEAPGKPKLLEALKQTAASKQSVVWDNCCRYPDTNEDK